MKRTATHGMVALACLAALIQGQQPVAQAESVSVPTEFVLPVKLHPCLSRVMALESPQAVVGGAVGPWSPGEGSDGGGAHRTLLLAATVTWYDVTYLRAYNGRAETVSVHGGVPCLELVPSDAHNPDPYRWALWWREPPGAPRWCWVFAPEGGRTYLAFSDGPGLYLADVTEPRDPTFAFHQDFSHGPRAYETVPYGLVGEKMLEMGFPYDFQFERPFVEPTSLLRGQHGALVLEVRFTHNGFWGTLVKEGDEWKLVNVQKDFPGGRDPNARQREAAAAMLEAQQRGREETEQLAKPASPAGPGGVAPDEATPVGGEDAPAESARAAE